MPDVSLESLAERMDAMEKKLAALSGVVPPTRDWRSVVGISEDNELTRAVLAEIEARSDTERAAALEDVS